MALIEGIGDELVVFAIVVVAIVVLVFAWLSTYVRDPPEIAAHVAPNGAVSQNLDFPGTIEDDLERIANEIEEEAEAVENEISVLTLQRTAFLQTLTSGDARRENGDDDDDEENEDGNDADGDDEDDDNADEDVDEIASADNDTDIQSAPENAEAIPTFEFPCPLENSTLSSASQSSPSAPPTSAAPSPSSSSSRHFETVTIPESTPATTSSSSSSSSSSSTHLPPQSPVVSGTTVPVLNASTVAGDGDASSMNTTSAGVSTLRHRTPAIVGGGGGCGDAGSRSGNTATTETEDSGSSNLLDGHMIVRIKFLNDVIREMRVKSTDTIQEFKATFFADELASSNRVRLIFNGQMLSDHLSFGHYNITNNTVIHCLVSRGVVGVDGAGGRDAGRVGGGGGAQDDAVIIQELDLSRLVFPLVAVILSCVWYFRVQYRQFFNATSSVALLFLTVVFFFFVFTSLRNRTVVVNNNVNNVNNNNNNNSNNNNNNAENATRPNGLVAS